MSATDKLLTTIPPLPSSGIKALAKLGFAAIGVVYVLMGVLALLAAMGVQRGARADKQEAMQHLQQVPGGSVLLGLIALGLLGYILWRFAQALLDTEGKGTSLKGLSFRFWYVCSGLFYSGLAIYAARLALQGHADAGTDATKTLATEVLSWPGGDWLLIVGGVVTIFIGLYQGYRAFSGQLQSDVSARQLSAAEHRLVFRAAQVGVTARGIVVGIIGYFFVQAGQQSRAGAVGSTDEAFDFLATAPASLPTASIRWYRPAIPCCGACSG
ncbi:DUF1206 domain-containing protein [Hymenobacter siberiensis]|uniref:DUF1206 domain-containing protein n=1 Tax=Hymenobacter siberiensis TaxID=2848396 RepID=UPI001C1DD517|nr:DUF1206 domain-containing protein [Hymenobacter siberiensis]